MTSLSMILDSAVQDAKAMQYVESEAFGMGADHSQKVKAATISSTSDSKDWVDLTSSTAESRMIQLAAGVEQSVAAMPSSVSLNSWKEQDDLKISLIEKIQRFSQERFSAHLIMKRWLKGLKHPPFVITALKIISLPAYLGLLGVGFLTTTASIDQLVQAQYSQALSSNIAVRVNFANAITNVGALFACLTDLPAISYVTYLFHLRSAHVEVMHEALDNVYFVVVDSQEISSNLREELYQLHLENLSKIGVDRFYLRPDPKSKTGAIYQTLAPLLNDIDQEIQKETSLQNSYRDIWANLIGSIHQTSRSKKLAKATLGLLCLGTWAISSFLILENGILLFDTPVRDLFSSDSVAQENEAFYITQCGGVFSAVTAFGATGYISWLSLLKNPYMKMMNTKIRTCFEKLIPPDLSLDQMQALRCIRDLKLRSWQ